ncbi:MAG: hypothetical protein II919_02655 [Lachnospiraceae bacterium]|nr:hypothetical protein [Lachnospiraceae bacterium]MBQ3664991.1 hypothetical protein [Lachnospiraceae bacterium]
MNERDSAGRQLLLLLLGMLMCGSGLYIFAKHVTVSTYGNGFNGMYSRFGLFGGNGVPGGLVLVPLIIGIVVWVIFPKSFAGKFITMLGTLFIIFGVISAIRLEFPKTSLYELIIMLVLIFGGGALALRILFMPDADTKNVKRSKIDDINDKLNE